MTIPHKTRRAIREHGPGYHRIAAALGINVKYVHDFMKKGKEPTDRTESGRAVRVKMGFSPHKRRPRKRQPKPRPPEYERWWRRLPKEVRSELKRQLWTSRSF